MRTRVSFTLWLMGARTGTSSSVLASMELPSLILRILGRFSLVGFNNSLGVSVISVSGSIFVSSWLTELRLICLSWKGLFRWKSSKQRSLTLGRIRLRALMASLCNSSENSGILLRLISLSFVRTSSWGMQIWKESIGLVLL